MKVAILWLIDENGEILLSQRAAHMNSDSGMWGPSVSGKIEVGEEAATAAVREAEEELGIKASTLAPIFLHEAKHDHQDGKLRELLIHYVKVPRSASETFTLEPQEVAATKWVSLAQLENLLAQEPENVLISSDTGLWKDIFKYLKTVTPA